MYTCQYCKKEFEGVECATNLYCSWECSVNECRDEGCEFIQPNNLPITSMKADGTCMEHEHADDKDYKFPVTINDYYDPGMPEKGAVLYYNDHLVLTLCECCYFMFSRKTGKCLYSSFSKDDSSTLNVDDFENMLVKLNR